MSDIYQITLTTQTGETFTGKMSRRQPELVNGFVPLATEDGGYRRRLRVGHSVRHQPAEQQHRKAL